MSGSKTHHGQYPNVRMLVRRRTNVVFAGEFVVLPDVRKNRPAQIKRQAMALLCFVTRAGTTRRRRRSGCRRELRHRPEPGYRRDPLRPDLSPLGTEVKAWSEGHLGHVRAVGIHGEYLGRAADRPLKSNLSAVGRPRGGQVGDGIEGQLLDVASVSVHHADLESVNPARAGRAQNAIWVPSGDHEGARSSPGVVGELEQPGAIGVDHVNLGLRGIVMGYPRPGGG